MKLEVCSPTQNMISQVLREMGENPEREGLLRTPERFEKALKELTSGYLFDAAQVVGEGVFESERSGLVSVKDIEFFSLCEHHMLPFWGKISIAYLPAEKILGLSKLARVVEVFSRRLQVQERLTREVAEAITDLVNPRAVFVTCQAQHMCMMMRGVRKVSSTTKTEFGIGLDSLSADQRDRMWKVVE